LQDNQYRPACCWASITANWNSSGEKWVVPVGGGVGRLFKVAKLPINIQLSVYHNVITPKNGARDLWEASEQDGKPRNSEARCPIEPCQVEEKTATYLQLVANRPIKAVSFC
jgi:hypothetical protein